MIFAQAISTNMKHAASEGLQVAIELMRHLNIFISKCEVEKGYLVAVVCGIWPQPFVFNLAAQQGDQKTDVLAKCCDA